MSQAVLDPVARSITHLVVEPKHRSGLGKLVPLGLVDVNAGAVNLRCTLAEFDKLEPAEQTNFLPGNNGGYGGYSAGQMVVLPHYRLVDADAAGGRNYDLANAFQPVVSDTVPIGEVAVRRGDPVQATDGQVGQVQGLVINPHTHHVTHVLLEEGHLWGRKQVTIPISAVTRVARQIHVSLTTEQVRDLPSVDIEQPIG